MTESVTLVQCPLIIKLTFSANIESTVACDKINLAMFVINKK